MSILKDSESSKKIGCVINTVETASRLIVHAINNLDLSVFRAASDKTVPLSIIFANGPDQERAVGVCLNSFDLTYNFHFSEK